MSKKVAVEQSPGILEAIASLVIALAMISLIASIVFQSLFIELFSTVIWFVQSASLMTLGAGAIMLLWLSGDRLFMLLERVEQWRQQRAITAQQWAQVGVIEGEAAVHRATAIAAGTVVEQINRNRGALVVRGDNMKLIEPFRDKPEAEALQLVAPLLELMPLLMKCDNILIVARRGAGKSNLIRRIIDTRQGVIVLDPHASPKQWGHHEVIGAGLNHGAIETHLHESIEADRAQRYRKLGQGIEEFPQATYVFDEMTEITSETDVVTPVQRLLNCRKVNINCVVGGHSMNAKDIGLKGSFNLLKNFDAVVKIDYNKATEERRYWLCLQPQTHHDEFQEAVNPGIYVPAVQATPQAVSEPSIDSSNLVHGRYDGRDLDVALCIQKGWSKTKTREAITGGNAEIGQLYDRISAELAAEAEAAAEPVSLQKPERRQMTVAFVPGITGQSKSNGEVVLL